MRGLTKRWRMIDSPAAPSPQLTALTLTPLARRILAARGFSDPDQIRDFCQPKLASLCDTALMPNIDAAAARIIQAIRNNQSIVIYGDYDVDGITAAAILFHTIKTIQPSARIHTYVPHRLDEGYGLNCDALRQLKTEGADLAITVDCGITAVQSAQTAKEINLDLIITDHHEFSASLPDANALVHPRLPGSRYPFADLCGAGVAFKLAWHLAKTWCNSERVSEVLQKTLLNMLPLVALGTIADVVPLLGENRILTAFGLRLIKQTPLPGLRALIEASGLADEKIDCERVGFSLAPRLNACGRMGHAAEAVKLLTDASPDEAAVIARQLTDQNTHRQSVERRIFEQALKMAEDAGMIGDNSRAIVLADPSWHPGVVGIVCSRLVEKFGRPVVLLNQTDDLCKGSARSIDGYSIHEGLSAAASFLTTFGGHAMAAGLSMHTQNLQAFTQALTAHANENIPLENLVPALQIDCEANLLELDLPSVQWLHSLAPFGRSNRAPVILIRDAILAEAPRQMGANGKHLSLSIRQDASAAIGETDGGEATGAAKAGGRKFMRTVWWNAGNRASDFAAGMRLDLAIEPKLNEWNGRINVEGHLHDLRICEPALA